MSLIGLNSSPNDTSRFTSVEGFDVKRNFITPRLYHAWGVELLKAPALDYAWTLAFGKCRDFA